MHRDATARPRLRWRPKYFEARDRWRSRASLTFVTPLLRPKQILHRLPHDLSADVRDGLGEWNVFGADFDAVLRVATLLDAAVAHQRLQAIDLQRFARGMGVEQAYLRNGGRTDEASVVIELGASFHAAAARDAARQGI